MNSGNKKNMPENYLYTTQEKVLIMLTKPICKQVSNFVTIIDLFHEIITFSARIREGAT